MVKIIGVSGKKQSGKTSLAYYLKAKILQEKEFKNSDSDIVVGDQGEVYLTNKTAGYPAKNVEELSSNIVGVYSFGDTLKECCIQTFGLDKEQCYGTDEQKNTLTKYKWDNLPRSIRMKYSNQSEKQQEYTTDDSGQFGITTTRTVDMPRSGNITGRELMQVFGTDVARNMFHDNIWVDSTFNKIKRDNVDIAIIADVRFPSEVNSIVNNKNDYKIIRLCRNIHSADQHDSETSLDDFDWDELSETMLLNNEDLTIEDKNRLVYEWLSKDGWLFKRKETLNG